MSNQIIPGRPDDPRKVDGWLHIDDFTPGIWDNSYIASTTGIVPAPLGAAVSDGTFCCASLGGGGLGPLPKLTDTFTYTPGFPGALDTFYIVGFIVNPGLNNVDTEIVIILEGDDGTDHYVLGWSTVTETGDSNIILNSTSASVGAGIFGAPYPVWTRMALDPSTTNPTPELVFPSAVGSDPSGSSGHLYIYPPILEPTSFAVQDLIVSASSTTGQTIAYGSRVLVLSGLDYPWPAGGGINTNENINFTDPPESTTYGNQKTILSTEVPWGYGAWGSVSVGELILIKKYGGAVILNGDIFSPSSVIPLPGVESTGDFVGQAQATQIGLAYCSENRGAWLWNGGNTSQKISGQLHDDFYDTGGIPGSNNYGFNVARWQDWLLFSNNYLYNADTNGWWRLFPPTGEGNAEVTGRTFWWWSQGRFGHQMYGAPTSVTTSDRVWYVRFDNQVSADHWQWVSQPTNVVPNAARVTDVTNVTLTASDPTGSDTATVTVTIGSWSETTTTTIGTEPTVFRFNAGSGSVGLTQIQVTLNGDNASGAAPIVHSLDVGFQTRALQGAKN